MILSWLTSEYNRYWKSIDFCKKLPSEILTPAYSARELWFDFCILLCHSSNSRILQCKDQLSKIR